MWVLPGWLLVLGDCAVKIGTPLAAVAGTDLPKWKIEAAEGLFIAVLSLLTAVCVDHV